MMQTVTISQTEYYELLKYKEVIKSMEDMIHEPEFNKEFIERVKAAEKRVKKGEGITFESVDDMKAYISK